MPSFSANATCCRESTSSRKGKRRKFQRPTSCSAESGNWQNFAASSLSHRRAFGRSDPTRAPGAGQGCDHIGGQTQECSVPRSVCPFRLDRQYYEWVRGRLCLCYHLLAKPPLLIAKRRTIPMPIRRMRPVKHVRLVQQPEPQRTPDQGPGPHHPWSWMPEL